MASPHGGWYPGGMARYGFAMLLGMLLAAAGCHSTHAAREASPLSLAAVSDPTTFALATPPKLDWEAALDADHCRDQRPALAHWSRHTVLKEHAWGTWMLCALAHGDRDGVRRTAQWLAARPSVWDDWRNAAAWAAWWLEPATAPVPARAPAAWLDRPLWPRLQARVASDPAAPWAQAAYAVLAVDPRWPTAVRTALAAAVRTEARLPLAERLVRAGQRAAAWEVLAPLWGTTAPAAVDVWWPEGNAEQWGWFVDLAFSLRKYEVAAAAAERLVRRWDDGQGWLLWGRALARQGRSDAARAVWQQSLAVRRDVWAVRMAYRMGFLDESDGNLDGAAAWYARTAALPAAHGERDEAAFRAGWLAFKRGDSATARALWVAAATKASDIVAVRRLRYWSWRAGDEAARRTLLDEAPLSYYAWLTTLHGADSPLTYITWQSLPAPSTAAVAALAVADALAMAGFMGPAAAVARRQLAFVAAPADAALVLERLQRYGDTEAAMRDFWQSAVATRYRETPPLLNRDAFRLQHPRPFAAQVSAAAARFGIDPHLLWAVMREESHFAPRIVSFAGAVGLVQIMPATAARVAARHGLAYSGPENLVRPEINIPIAAAYLSDLSRRYNGDLFATIAAYNAGEGAVDGWLASGASARPRDAWVEDIPYAETRRYVIKVLRSYIRYRALYTQSLPTARSFDAYVEHVQR